MPATRHEIETLGKSILAAHSHDALALASMIGFFYNAALRHPDTTARLPTHMSTLWHAVAAHMDRCGVTREQILAAGKSIGEVNQTIALLESLPD